MRLLRTAWTIISALIPWVLVLFLAYYFYRVVF